ncbi:MerR family transcriptional regulator [Streptomyces sp. NRRL S-1521]|uniref:MerR family transcriptional regulator n=1 Tax=Streptomyces sp. NRRL S-1521 TaxID=1609100 RepID=UPI000748EBC7|nr:MerR family transcriptional regulator [Streptomyces sp. NRRL S-1521]KUL51198.1 MerR family transcriptional regulator [Streptomyces sp. NRRL S-1521]
MTWSTRQLAELAGTTLKTVRHYHQLGLLEEPERAPNGYKRYDVRHLVRLMRIRRLADLGVPLCDIPTVAAADARSTEVLRALDAELAANIERQQHMRRQLAAVLEDRASLDLPVDFGAAATTLPRAQQDLLVAYSSVLTPAAMSLIRDQYARPRDEVAEGFEQLPADAPEDVRRRLAAHLAAEVRAQRAGHTFITDLDAASRRNETLTRSVVTQALITFYNEAQLDVLRHLHALLEQEEADGGADGDSRRGGKGEQDHSGNPDPHRVTPGATG